MASAAPNDRFTLFADNRAAERITLDAPNVAVVRVRQSQSPTLAAAAGRSRSPVDMLRFTRAVWKHRVDAFLAPAVYTYFPLPPRLPAVVNILDAIAERFPELTLPSIQARVFWNAKVRLAAWQARLILTLSDYTARDLEQVLHIPRHRIRVTGAAAVEAYRPSESAADIAKAIETFGIPTDAKWFIYVGGLNPHKRVEHLVRAHGDLVQASDDPPHLLLVGSTESDVFHSGAERITEEIKTSGTEQYVHLLGYQPDEMLRHLHSGAIALVLSSVCEGFGLSAFEAAACGTPVIATTESPLPELLSGGGLFVAPDDHESLVAAMLTLSHDEPRRLAMGRIARERASSLTWSKTGTVVLDALRQVAA